MRVFPEIFSVPRRQAVAVAAIGALVVPVGLAGCNEGYLPANDPPIPASCRTATLNADIEKAIAESDNVDYAYRYLRDENFGRYARAASVGLMWELTEVNPKATIEASGAFGVLLWQDGDYEERLGVIAERLDKNPDNLEPQLELFSETIKDNNTYPQVFVDLQNAPDVRTAATILVSDYYANQIPATCVGPTVAFGTQIDKDKG